jgi:hypothetical protein
MMALLDPLGAPDLSPVTFLDAGAGLRLNSLVLADLSFGSDIHPAACARLRMAAAILLLSRLAVPVVRRRSCRGGDRQGGHACGQ